MKIHQALSLSTMMLVLAVASGCGSTGDVVADGKAVTGVDINPDKTSLTKGATLQFQAVVNYADGTSLDVTDHESTVWNTSDPDIASVTTRGMVTAVDEGVVDISADYKGEKGDEHFAVIP